MMRICLAAMLCVVMASCSSNGTTGTSARPRSTARLEITSPSSGETVDHDDVVAKLNLIGGRITKRVSTHIEPNVGHIHLRLDGKTITLLGSLEQRVPGVKAGQHVLEAEFVAADHQPFDPRVLSAVSFRAR